MKDGKTVGHLPRKLSKVCSLFLKRGGTIQCTVRGRRHCSTDLPQGGLETYCSPVILKIYDKSYNCFLENINHMINGVFYYKINQ